MKYSFAVLLLIGCMAAIITACRNNFDDPAEGQTERNAREITDYLIASGLVTSTSATTQGMTYLFTTPASSTVTLKTGQEAEFAYRLYWLDKGRLRVVDTSSLANPIRLPFGANVMLTGLEQALGMLQLGQRGLFFMPNNLAYGGREASSIVPVPPYSAVAFDLTLLGIRTEAEQMQEYIDANNLGAPTFTTSNNIIIYRTTAGTGPAIANNQRVTVSLSGKTLRGAKPFDIRDSTTVRTGSGELIAGLDSAARRLRVGDKALVLIPSTSAYGTQGTSDRKDYYIVPPYAPVVYDLTIISSRN